MMARMGSLAARNGRWAIAFVAFVVLAATTGTPFAVVVLIIGALAAAAWASVRGLDRRRRTGAKVAVLVGALSLVSLSGHLLAPSASPVRPLALAGVPAAGASAAQDASTLVQQLPDRSSSWLLLGDTGDPTTPTSSAYLGYERALLLDPHQVRAALGLARLYLSRPAS
jgi:cytochrome c-type biogenesis protein CcmH/NrfG